MNKSIITLSFDDGRQDQFHIAKDLLIPMRISATFNITTGYLDGTCPYENIRCEQDPITIEQLQWMHEQPLLEIAMHGDHHLNTVEDIKNGGRKLRDWLQIPNDQPLGFASPGSGLDLDFVTGATSPLKDTSISYYRVDYRYLHHKYLAILARKASRVLHFPFLYRMAYADTIMENCPDKIIYSVPVLKDIHVEEVLALVHYAVSKKAALVLMFHSIDTEFPDNWTWPRDRFEQLLRELSQMRDAGKLEILTTSDLYERLKRES